MADTNLETTDSTVATFAPAPAPAPADGADAALAEEELLVEEISIDGMCGVY